MVIKIERTITDYSVKPEEQPEGTEHSPSLAVVEMSEAVKRPDKLIGTTYKLSTPDHVSPHAMYITINDIVLNENTDHEDRRPFEIFINSKNLEHYQWIVALTLIMSAVFRKGGDITFLVEELRSVFDPRGGYWNQGTYMPSIIAEIGQIIDQHLTGIGVIDTTHEQGSTIDTSVDVKNPATSGRPCSKCNQPSVFVRDGCETCLSCGDSKCS